MLRCASVDLGAIGWVGIFAVTQPQLLRRSGLLDQVKHTACIVDRQKLRYWIKCRYQTRQTLVTKTRYLFPKPNGASPIGDFGQPGLVQLVQADRRETAERIRASNQDAAI